ncbi:hypothetical protein HWV62_4467 [Athelia sp. TMB]|nr:hypothetical protein HWV62_4467 [Athelia sp. TMB]
MSTTQRTRVGRALENSSVPGAIAANNLLRSYIQLLRSRRPISPSERARFDIYAARIHHFSASALESALRIFPCPDTTCLRALAPGNPENLVSLFPRLRSLDWGSIAPKNDEALRYIPLFVGKVTQRITFSLDESWLGPRVISAVQAVMSDFPSIQHVKIVAGSDDDGDPIRMTAEALWQIFRHNLTLQSVELGAHLISQPLVDHLAGLENLKTLSMKFDGPISSFPSSAFPALERLKLTSQSYQTMASFLSVLSAPASLTKVEFVSDHYSIFVLGEVQTLFNAIQLYLSHSRLDFLRIKSSFNLFEGVTTIIDESVLRPLLEFRNIKCLELRMHHSFRMGDAMAIDMAAAWPLLEILWIGGVGWSQQSTITLVGLMALLHGMRHLQSINIAINVTEIDFPDNADIPINTKLSSMRLQDSILCDNVDAMILLLSRATPNLEFIDSWDNGFYAADTSFDHMARMYLNRWSEVERRMPKVVGVSLLDRKRDLFRRLIETYT